MGNKEVIQNLWKLCNLLRDEGLTDVQLLDEFSYMLCIRILKEKNAECAGIWNDFLMGIHRYTGKEFIRQYHWILNSIEDSCDQELKLFFYEARTNIRDARHLEILLMSIEELDFNSKDEVIEFYDALTYRYLRSGIGGQYITPQVLSRVLVELIAPQKEEECNNPACGSFRFMIDAYEYVHKHNVEEWQQQQNMISQCFSGTEINPLMYRVSIVHALLYGIAVDNICCGNALEEENAIGRQRKQYDVIISDPPMGGRIDKYAYWNKEWSIVSTSNLSLLFLQHIYHSLKLREDEGARAAVIVPDGVLFDTREGRVIRRYLIF